MIDYAQLDEFLIRMQAGTEAAECHGFLCGIICMTDNPPESLWQDYLDLQLTHETLVSETRGLFKDLIRGIREDLQSPDLDFQLLLPDDDSPVRQRAGALVDWCHGFLNGCEMGENGHSGALPADCSELLDDLNRIRHMVLPVEEQTGDEAALAELEEYIRMGAITMYTVISGQSLRRPDPGKLH